MSESKYYRIKFRKLTKKREHNLDIEPHIKISVLKPITESRHKFIITRDGYKLMSNLDL